MLEEAEGREIINVDSSESEGEYRFTERED